VGKDQLKGERRTVFMDEHYLRFFKRYLTLKVPTGFTPTAVGLFAKNVFANFFQVLYFWVFGATDILVSHKSNLYFNNLFKFR
jgi:hypothetical protein